MLTFILTAMALLSHRPLTEPHEQLGKAIANVIEEKGCLYRGEDCERRTGAVLAVWAWYESRFTLGAKGKHNDCGPFQHVTNDKDECDLLRSNVAHATSVAWSDMRASLDQCGTLSAFASGNCRDGMGVVRHRMPMATWILSRVK